MSRLRSRVAFGILLGVVVLSGIALAAPTFVDQLTRPKIKVGALILPSNESIGNDTDDMILMSGVGGADNTDLQIDLDGTRPVLSSVTDTTVEIAEALVIGGVLTMENSETIDTTVDAQFRVTRNNAGTVVFMGADNAGEANTTYDTTGAGAIAVGSADVTAITLTTDGSGDGEVLLSAESISAAEILNLTRSMSLPAPGWYNCTSDAIISTDDGADAQPDWAFINSGIVIAYDDTGGSPDTEFVCTSFVVPQGYVSGGTMAFVVTADAATATIEDIGCAWSINGAADSGETSAALVSQAAVQTVTVTPAGAPAAGSSINVRCRQSDAAPDDVVYIHGVEFRYTSTQ